ncbi:hypothetical protein [Paraburkholderia sp.]|uniref:hypothetical protein n=1 Tax=Paraburkholderia sp. TaxID=1926495 RepID=UPI003C7B6BE4
MEAYKILAAMLRRGQFTVAEVAGDVEAKPNTVYTVLSRRKDCFAVAPAAHGPGEGRPGGRTNLYTVTADGRQTLMSELEGLFAAIDQLPPAVDLSLKSSDNSSYPPVDVEASSPSETAEFPQRSDRETARDPVSVRLDTAFRKQREPDSVPAILLAAEHDLRNVRSSHNDDAKAAVVRNIAQKLEAASHLLSGVGGGRADAAKARLISAQRKLSVVKSQLFLPLGKTGVVDLIKHAKFGSFSKILKKRSSQSEVFLGYLSEKKNYVVGRVESAFEQAGSTVTVQPCHAWMKKLKKEALGDAMLVLAIDSHSMKNQQNLEIVKQVMSSKRAVVVNADKDRVRARNPAWNTVYVQDAANKSLDGMLVEMRKKMPGFRPMRYKPVAEVNHTDE